MKISYALPSTNFKRPNHDQLRELARIVRAAHPWIEPVDEPEFERAFFAVGYMFRLSEPDKRKFFHSHVDACNDFLRTLRWNAVDGPAVLAAVFAHGDVPVQFANPRLGRLLGVGLNPHSGRGCSNRWRDVLAGSAPLLAVVTPPEARGLDNMGRPVPQTQIFKQENGRLRPVGENEYIW